MSLRTSFRSKLLFLSVAPLVVALSVTLLAVMRTVERDVDLRARKSLFIGGNVVAEFLAARQEQLHTSVEVLAADLGLKQAAATMDNETIRSVLLNHGRRVGAELAVFLDTDGRMIASTVGTEVDPAAFSLPSSAADRAAVTIAEDSYHVFSVPVLAPTPMGRVVLGFRMDERTLQRIEGLTGLQADIERNAGMMAGIVDIVADESGDWLTLSVPFADLSSDFSIVLRRSLKEAMQPYTQARSGLIVFGILLLALVTLASAWLSGSVAKPLRELTAAAKRMISGNYGTPVRVSADDELGELASSFNAMRTAIAEREERISHQAMHDPLTGLPNRHMIMRALEGLIDGAASQETICVLSIRLLRMHAISSTLGHSAGDELIGRAAENLGLNLDSEEILGHVGSDEFALIIPRADVPIALEYADRIESIFGKGISLGRINISLQTEIGIAEYPQHGSTAAELLRNAAIARSEAATRQDRVNLYETGREEHYVRQLKIINDLRGALNKEQVFLNFQPKIALPDGSFCGAEALVRWQHPELGLLLPDSFIPAAEEAGTVLQLTRYVLARALRQCHQWEASGLVVGISVNLSARDLRDENLTYFVLQELKDNEIEAKRLTLEITENSVMQDVSQAINVLECLRDIGIRISIDDFGTGYSSLAQLKNMPLHELKIDKSFIMNLTGDRQDAAIVQTTIELAHNMGLDVVAEGVENEDTMRRLSKAGCQQAQGNFLSRPVSSGELVEWCANFEPVSYEERRRRSRPFADSA